MIVEGVENSRGVDLSGGGSKRLVWRVEDFMGDDSIGSRG